MDKSITDAQRLKEELSTDSLTKSSHANADRGQEGEIVLNVHNWISWKLFKCMFLNTFTSVVLPQFLNSFESLFMIFRTCMFSRPISAGIDLSRISIWCVQKESSEIFFQNFDLNNGVSFLQQLFQLFTSLYMYAYFICTQPHLIFEEKSVTNLWAQCFKVLIKQFPLRSVGMKSTVLEIVQVQGLYQ